MSESGYTKHKTTSSLVDCDDFGVKVTGAVGGNNIIMYSSF